jgi:hypothetical protein
MPASTRRLTIQTALTVPPQRLTQNEREYLVAPAVMIVEGVLNGGLVTGDAIRSCRWDNVPVTINHPMSEDGQPRSAQAPDVAHVGRVYRTQYHAQQAGPVALTRAQSELWLDVATMRALGGDAEQALQMVETQNALEVSTAFFSAPESRRGTFQGVPYSEVHTDLLADHLALLPNSLGACSWADGCGCPRLNAKEVLMKPLSLLAKLRVFCSTAEANLAANQTDADLRESLYGALAREMGVDYTPIFIDALDVAAQTFTYRQGERLVQRSWTVENDQIVLTPDTQDVQRQTSYVPVTQERKETPRMEPTAAIKTRATALIASAETAWTEDDRATLEAMSDAQLARLEPDSELIALRREQTARKTTLVKQLVENSWCTLSEASLKSLPLAELEGLIQMQQQDASYAGQGLPALRVQGENLDDWKPKSILTKQV